MFRGLLQPPARVTQGETQYFPVRKESVQAYLFGLYLRYQRTQRFTKSFVEFRSIMSRISLGRGPQFLYREGAQVSLLLLGLAFRLQSLQLAFPRRLSYPVVLDRFRVYLLLGWRGRLYQLLNPTTELYGLFLQRGQLLGSVPPAVFRDITDPFSRVQDITTSYGYLLSLRYLSHELLERKRNRRGIYFFLEDISRYGFIYPKRFPKELVLDYLELPINTFTGLYGSFRAVLDPCAVQQGWFNYRLVDKP